MNGTMFVLFVVFLVLKLAGVVAWSWWLVTLPLWIGIAIALAVVVFTGSTALIVSSIAAVYETLFKK